MGYIPEEDLPWRFRPEVVGEALCTGDLDTHAEQLLVQFTGLRIRRVLAMPDTCPKFEGQSLPGQEHWQPPQCLSAVSGTEP